MTFLAKSIIESSSHPAPKEYESLPLIISAKPKGDYEEISLQELDKTNILAWYVKVGIDWRLASGFFVISKERIIHARGARYTKEKEVFVKKYYTELLECIITRNMPWKHPDCIKIIRLAREEVGYSEVTSAYDVWYHVSREFLKQYKAKK